MSTQRIKKAVSAITVVSLLFGFAPVKVKAATPEAATPVDNTAPVVTVKDIDGNAVEGWTNKNVEITFTDDLDTAPKAFLNSEEIESGMVVTAESAYVLVVSDATGNTTTVGFGIDKTAPELSLLGENPMSWEVGVPFKDPGVVTELLSKTQSNAVTEVNFMQVGDYTVTYTGIDKAGNLAAPKTRLVKVQDTLAPVIDAGKDIITNSLTGLLSKTDVLASDPSGIEKIEWQYDSTMLSVVPNLNDNLKAEITANLEGTHVITLVVTDKLGHTSTDTFNFTWDKSAPIVSAGADVVTGKPVVLTGEATDVVSGISSVQWSSESDKVVIEGADTLTPTVSATEEGAYKIKLVATDKAGNVLEDEMELIWDTTAPGAVTEVNLVPGEGFIELHWKNPTDSDFEKVAIYRSLEEGVVGDVIGYAASGLEVYSDQNLELGKNYYYTLVPFDFAGNAGPASLQLVGTPSAPRVASIETTVDDGKDVSDSGNDQKEIKANTEEPKEETTEEESKNLPYVGIGVLVLLGLLGVYLLYLQYPGMFGKLMFWKKPKTSTGKMPNKK